MYEKIFWLLSRTPHALTISYKLKKCFFYDISKGNKLSTKLKNRNLNKTKVN